MTFLIEAEPERQAQGGAAPPSTPKRTAVGTDDHEKRPCKSCGHTVTDHMGIVCTGGKQLPVTGITIQTSPGFTLGNCRCSAYVPSEVR